MVNFISAMCNPFGDSMNALSKQVVCRDVPRELNEKVYTLAKSGVRRRSRIAKKCLPNNGSITSMD